MPGHEQQLLGTDLFDEKFNYLYEDGLNLEDDDEEESELDSDTTEIEEQPAAKAVSGEFSCLICSHFDQYCYSAESQQNKPVLSSTLRSTSRKTKGRKRKINKLHRCPHCDRTYPFPCELRRHLPVHTGVLLHQCATCSKSFKTQTELKQHQLFHSDVSAHQCSTCSQTFKKKGDLTRHRLTHSEDRAYECPTCSQSFRRLDQIRGSFLDVYHHKVEFYQAIKYGKPENASVFAKLNSTFVLLFFL